MPCFAFVYILGFCIKIPSLCFVWLFVYNVVEKSFTVKPLFLISPICLFLLRTLLNNILHRKVNWIGHILRRNCLNHDAIEGQMTEVKGEEHSS